MSDDYLISLRKYSIQSFTKAGAILTTLRGSFIIEDASECQAIKALQEQIHRPTQRSDIMSLLAQYNSLDPIILYDRFRDEYGLFHRFSLYQPKLDGISIFADNTFVAESVAEGLRGITSMPIEIYSIRENAKFKSKLVLVYVEDYSEFNIDDIYSLETTPGSCTFLTSYVIRREFIVDNMHRLQGMEPCHMCRLLRLQDYLKDDFLATPRIAGKASRPFEPALSKRSLSLPISNVERGLITFHAFRCVAGLIDIASSEAYHDELMRSISVDLSNGDLSYSVSTFHPGCGCWRR